jgi:large subunit ribosomal protein L21
MKKAVIRVAGGKQYLVSEGDKIMVDLLPEDIKDVKVEVLMLVDGDKSTVGTPVVAGAKVDWSVVEGEVKGEKLRVIRYKSKKRVHKEIGHRQKYTQIEIKKIA